MKNKQNNWRSWVVALVLPLWLLVSRAAAQATAAVVAADQPEMADALHQNGKIYVVVLVIVIILSGLLLYLVRLDGKVSRLEREAESR